MSVERGPDVSPRLHAALEELKGLVRQHYPEATFQIVPSPENPETILLKPVVDVEDRDEVMDVVIERLVELQSEEHLSLFVVPARPAARNEAIRGALQQAAPVWRKQGPPIPPR